MRNALRTVVHTEQSARVEILARGAQGRTFAADVALAPIAGYDRWDVVCSIRDISERRRAEATLAHERDLLQSLMDNIPDEIYFKDKASRFTRVNRALAQALGLERPDAVLGKTDFDFQQPERAQHFYAEEQEIFATGQPMIDHVEIAATASAQDQWFSTTKVPVRDLNGTVTGLVGISRNITERIRLEAVLQQALAEQKELSALKSRFISTTSHEFRTPLSIIASSVGLLEKALDTMSGEQRQRHFDKIARAINHMVQLLSDVLTFGQAEDERQEFSPESLNLEDHFRAWIDETQALAKPDHEFSFSCTGDCRNVVVDKKLLREVFVNVLTNSIKYSPSGGLVGISLDCREGQVQFRIADQGIGIPEEDQKHLFEPFHRAGNVGSIQGTGLGLAIALMAVKQHDGSMEVESKVGRGTSVSISIPDKKPNANASSA